MKKIAVVLTLAVALCFVLASLAQAGPLSKTWAKKNMHNSQKAAGIPTWKMMQGDGTINSVPWVDATNPRFAVYDYITPLDETDDVVLDKETGLVWEKIPDQIARNWADSVRNCWNKDKAGHKGWRLPALPELMSLIDSIQPDPPLPSGHPFSNVATGDYWTMTQSVDADANKHTVNLGGGGSVGQLDQTSEADNWCCRGGAGYDGQK